MGISYNAKASQTGYVDLFTRQFDGNETDITSLGHMSADEADTLAICLMEAASKAREFERDILNKRRESLTADAVRIKGELERVMREIATIDEKQSKARPGELTGKGLMVDGTRVVVA